MPCNTDDVKSKQLTIRWSDGSGGNPADDGTRPLPDGTAYYESPDLYLSGGGDRATAKVGVANTVWAQVFNFGQQPVSGINVEVWVCNFTLGVNPASSLASSNPGNAPMTGYYAGTINPNESETIQVATWTPVPADAALNGGHVCMAGNCYADSGTDGAPFTGTDMLFLCDCHHAQHNIAVVQVPMAHIQNFRFRMYAANPSSRQAIEAAITLRPVQPVRPELEAQLAKTLLASPDVIAHPTTGLPALVEHLGGSVLQWAQSLPTSVAVAHPVGRVGTGTPLKLALQPRQHEVIETQVQFQPNERPGAVHVFDMTEHDAAGDLVGGARLITVLTP